MEHVAPDSDRTLRRHVDLDLPPEEVWELVVDDDERCEWFGGPTTIELEPGGEGVFTDPDGTRRAATVEVVEPSRRLAWTWWPEGERDGASQVEVELAPIPGGTRVSVIETPVSPAALGTPGTAFALAA